MKKKFLIAMSVLMVNVFAAVGCAGNNEINQPSEKQQATEETATTEQNTKQTSLCGTLDELKDFMFTVTDDEQVSYVFAYEEAPEGLDSVNVGDRIKVTYTGTVSEIDPFTGEVLSVEKQ